MSRNVFSLESFLDFAKRKPADESYEYSHPYHCACFQYFESIGLRAFYLSFEYNEKYANTWELLADPGCQSQRMDAAEHRSLWTWGQLAQRIEAELKLNIMRAF